MLKIDSVFGVIAAISEWSGKIISPMVVVILFLTLFEIFKRYVLNAPTVWAMELTGYLCGVYFMIGGAYVLRYKAHINLDILYNRFSPRGKAVLDLITSVLFFSFVGVLLWKGYDAALYSLKHGEVTITGWEMPTFWVRVCIPIAAFLILLQGIADFARNFFTAISKGKA